MKKEISLEDSEAVLDLKYHDLTEMHDTSLLRIWMSVMHLDEFKICNLMSFTFPFLSFIITKCVHLLFLKYTKMPQNLIQIYLKSRTRGALKNPFSLVYILQETNSPIIAMEKRLFM